MKKTILFFLFLYCQSVFAHTTSDSYLNINLSEQQGSVSWAISVRDLEYAVGLDVNTDGKITWAEILARKQVIEAYVLSRLTLYSKENQLKQSCYIDNNSLMVDDKTDGAYLVFDIISPCLNSFSNKNLSIDYQLMFDIDKNHRGLILIESQSKNVTSVASPESHIFKLQNINISILTVFADYVLEGIWHILIGLDHILFLLALLLPTIFIYKNKKWRHRERVSSSFVPVLKIVTAFTIAHSITLTLSVMEVVQLPVQLVEIAIAITVLLTCLHTIRPVFHRSLWELTFIFGLIHGFGFANVLIDLGLADKELALSLFAFNVGVEIGQLFIVCLFILFVSAVHRHWWYHIFIFRGGITVTALLSCIWIVERSLNYEIMGI